VTDVDDAKWLYTEIGQRIRKARTRVELTQQALADQAGVSRASIANIETGNQQLTLHTLWSIADAVEVSPCKLLTDWQRKAQFSNDLFPDDVPAATRAALTRITVGQSRTRR
jgi:transcriptional regulator with XRE-family HTH domain